MTPREQLPSSLTSEQDRHAILQTLHSYQQGFSGSRPDIAQNAYHKPCSFVDEQEVVLLNTKLEIEKFLKSVIDGLKSRGWHHSQWKEIYIHPMDCQRAMVSTLAVRYKTGGTELERIGGTYVFRKTTAGWKIAMALSHPPGRVIRLGDPYPLS
jgi:hypothetical protein